MPSDDEKKDLGPFDEEYLGDDYNSEEESLNNEGPTEGLNDLNDDEEDFPDDVPAVSVAKKKNILLLFLVVVIGLYFFWQFFSSDDKNVKPKAESESQEMSEDFREEAAVPKLNRDLEEISVRKSNKEEDNSVDNLIVAPPPPPLVEPTSQYTYGSSSSSGGNILPSLGTSGGEDIPFGRRLIPGGGGSSSGGPAPLPELGGGLYGGGSSGFSGRGGAGRSGVIVSEDYRERIQAPMFLMSNPDTDYVRERSGGGTGGVSGSGSRFPDRDYELDITGSARSDATFVGQLDSVILQGKVIDAVLETAINTDLPDGILRGVVSRDVYAESGNRILIPKGSKLIGSYSANVKFGQARVFIVWRRVIRPDGIDAILDSQATDLLGRTGVYGDLDNRFLEIFSSSILLSSISVAFAVAATELADPPESQTSTGAAGQVVEDTDPETQAILTAVESLGNQVSNVASEYVETKPRILVNQGTRLKVFVNKDVHFPETFQSDEDRVMIVK